MRHTLRHCRFFCWTAIASIVAATEASSQQSPTMRWSFATGPSAAFSNHVYVSSSADQFSFSSGDPIIKGAEHGMYNLFLGASRELKGSSLVIRGELLYNRSGSSPRPSYPSSWARPALRDEVYGFDLGVQWDALPSRRWSPYLLTTAGALYSRLGWSRDPNSRRVDETTTSYGPFVGAGAGLRLRVGKREYFTEFRRHAMPTVYSSKFVPLSFGVRF